jgi:NAD(P)-dependent dehydrogenase (short-subunit alcohol dehydrogenase family)
MAMGQLDGKVAIITGAGTGLGAACARTFANEGASLVLVGRREEKLEETRATLGDGSMRCALVPGDVALETTAAESVAVANERFGGVDILINNAGIHAHPLLVHETPPEEFDEFIAVDLRGPFLFTRAAVPSMMERNGGAIVNIASMVGYVGFKYGCSYAAAKGGLIALTQTTAADYGDRNIRANAIAAGGMEPVERGNLEPVDYERLTESVMSAGGAIINRIAHVDEVAALVLFLSGPLSQSMTGSIIPFDGGYSAH